MNFIRKAVGRGNNDAVAPDNESSPESLRSRTTVLYRTATGSGSRTLAGPFAGEDLRETTLVACALAGYTNAQIESVYKHEISQREQISGVSPLMTLEHRSVYSAYQAIQSNRTVAYRDLVYAADPVQHRLDADHKYYSLFESDHRESPAYLEEELKEWRFRWSDVIQTLEADSKEKQAKGDEQKAQELSKQAAAIRQSLDSTTDDQMRAKIMEIFRRKDNLRKFEEDSDERRGLIAENGGATGDAGYKNPRHVMAKAERARSTRSSKSSASSTNIAVTSIKDFASDPPQAQSPPK